LGNLWLSGYYKGGIMRKNIVKTLGIFTLALFVLSITGATAFSGSTNYNKTQENFTNSKVSLTENTVVEVTQIEQINSALKKGPVLLKIGAEWCGSCQKMKPILNKLATEYGGKATIMAADVGQSPKLVEYFSNELHVTKNTPSAFIVQAEDDKTVPVQNSIDYFTALKNQNIPAELHIYQKGGHGFGLAKDKGTASQWPSACINWLKEIGMIK